MGKSNPIECFGTLFSSQKELAEHYKIDRCTLRIRLKRGLSIEEAVSIPIRRQRRAIKSLDGKKLCVNCRQPIEITGNKWNHCIPCTRRYGAEHKRGAPRGTYIACWERQKGKCLCCSRSLRDAAARSPHLDHCHETGKIRGLLCHYCNTSLGIIRESKEHALALAEYITKYCDPLKGKNNE